MTDSDTEVGGSERPTCPQCGGHSVRFYEDLDGRDMRCEDCDEIVEQWTREHRGGLLNGPGTYQWYAAKARRL